MNYFWCTCCNGHSRTKRRRWPKFNSYTRPFAFHISSSCDAGSTDIPDPLSPLLPIVHRPR